MMNDDKTGIFDVTLVKNKLIADMLKEVSEALQERGYNPINQIVGYIISGDPGYISNYKNARSKITEYDRTEITATVLKDYLKKLK